MKKTANPLQNQLMLLLACCTFSLPNFSNEISVVTEYLAPYQVKNNDGSLGGFSTEVIHALFKITNDTPNIRVLPWARAYATAKHNKNTMIFSIAKTKSRLANFHWIGDLIYEEYYFWGLKSNVTLKSLSLEQLKQYRVATSRSSNEYEYLIEQQFDHIYPVVNEDQRTKMLYRNRIDIIIETEITLKALTKKLDLDFSQLNKLLFIDGLDTTLSIAFNINSDPSLIKTYQQAFLQLEKSGQLKAIQIKWNIPSTH